MAIYAITGANRGIGLAYVRELSSTASNTVIATVRSLTSDLSSLTALNVHNNVHILECDVSSTTSISRLSTSIPTVLPHGARIDYLINNAAILYARTETSLNLSPDA